MEKHLNYILVVFFVIGLTLFSFLTLYMWDYHHAFMLKIIGIAFDLLSVFLLLGFWYVIAHFVEKAKKEQREKSSMLNHKNLSK